MGTVLNWRQARGPPARHRGHNELIEGGARKWQNQSPMTGRRSMIAFDKSGRNNRHLSGPAHSATASAGYLISRTVGTPKRLVMLFADFALTRAIYPHASTSPTDDKNKSGSVGRIFCCVAVRNASTGRVRTKRWELPSKRIDRLKPVALNGCYSGAGCGFAHGHLYSRA
jgi:hypothetical protein